MISETARPGRRLRWTVIVVLCVAVTAVAIQMVWHHKTYRRFAEVEAGQLFRSGELKPAVLCEVIQSHKLKTVLTLLDDVPTDANQQGEAQVAREQGVELLRVPMPGDGRGSFDALDRAADIMADPANQPILVHCAAGVQRTGAAYVAYRLKHCGWDLQKALDENRNIGYPIDGKPELVDHLRAYYETHLRFGPASRPAATQVSNTN